MSKPPFPVLKAHHMGQQYRAAQVYESIGLPPEMALDPKWSNTCAIRMSVALIAAGVTIRPVSLTIKAGPFKGKMVQAGQRTLSEFLVQEIGQPEKYKSGPDARNAIAWRRGIVSFFRIGASRQGHIDLVSIEDWGQIQCSGLCYWDAEEVWFWQLQ